MFEHMFTHCKKHVYTIFKTYLPHAEKNAYSMLEDMIIPCLKIHFTQFLKTFFNNICKYAYTIFVALFVSCLKAMLCMKTCLHMISSIFALCLKMCQYIVGRHA